RTAVLGGGRSAAHRLLEPVWRPLDPPAAVPVSVVDLDDLDRLDRTAPVPDVAVLHATRGPDAAPDLVAGTHAAAHRVLDALQHWLADERTADSTLLVATRGAAGPALDGGTDPAAA
ncbi:hypothetical protein GTY88_40315, partial [Streptomyces sp. SID5926]|nr:hypothetical protein [Streptomyces sp. SID5926]